MYFDKEDYQKQDLEQIIPKLTPGTLQNLLKYQLLLWGLKDALHGKTNLSEPQVLKRLEQIESFLKPLHEIERENLKRFADNFLGEGGGRRLVEEQMERYNEKPLKRFIEVFGEKPSYPPLPSDYRGMMGGTSTE